MVNDESTHISEHAADWWQRLPKATPEQVAERQKRIDEEHRAAVIEAGLARSGMTERERTLDASDLDESIWNHARAAASAIDDGRWLFMHGIPGCGKTWLASALLRRAILAGRRGLSVHWVSMLARVRATYRPDASESEFTLMAPLESVNLLLLDDLGSTGDDTAHSRRLLLQVIHERDRMSAQTIITSNLTPGSLYRQLDPRTVDRLRSRCHVLKMPKRSLREDAHR